MRSFRLHYRNISLWIILILQLILIGSYFILPEPKNIQQNNLKVSFVKLEENKPLNYPKNLYNTLENTIYLPYHDTSDSYSDFNASLCYKDGTDLKVMRRSKSTIWKCECLPGWHGTDCGQPEIIWRALLRKPVLITGPRKNARRLIHIFKIDRFSLVLGEIRINELNDSIDLFVLYETTTGFLKNKLKKGFLKKCHQKILYLEALDLNEAWKKTQKVVKNLREDDAVVISGDNEIPHRYALQFIKLYDNWPQPLIFRYRWSVYGFFWLHPNRTLIRGGVSTISSLNEGDFELLYGNTSRNLGGKGLTVGDLNHFGGWFCEYCLESGELVDFLMSVKDLKVLRLNGLVVTKVDAVYLEDFIENGIYLNGKTELLRTHRSRERDYAPMYVTDNDITYDWLLINLYSKIDY